MSKNTSKVSSADSFGKFRHHHNKTCLKQHEIVEAGVCVGSCETHMVDGQNQEGPAPGTLGDDSEEPRVDGTEVVVLDASCDGHAVIAALLGGSFPEHVAELGAAVLRTP